MNRAIKDVIALVENILGAVTMMKIHVKNSNFLGSIMKHFLGSNGCIVKKTITTKLIF